MNIDDNLIGSWAFILGVVAAAVLGIGLAANYQQILTWVLFLLGLIVGFLNITAKETQSFLTAGTILVLLSALGIQVGVFSAENGTLFLVNILKSILTLFVPATIIVALKAVYMLAQD